MSKAAQFLESIFCGRFCGTVCNVVCPACRRQRKAEKLAAIAAEQERAASMRTPAERLHPIGVAEDGVTGLESTAR